MSKQSSTNVIEAAGTGSFSSATTIAALLFLAAKFPHRQFNSAELSVLSGVGRTTDHYKLKFCLGLIAGVLFDTLILRG